MKKQNVYKVYSASLREKAKRNRAGLLTTLTLMSLFAFCETHSAQAQLVVSAPDVVTSNQISTQQIVGTQQSTTNTILQNAQTIYQNTENDLKNLSGQTIANNNATTQAQANFHDVQDAREVTRRVEDQKMAAAMGATSGPSVCNAVTGGIAAQNMYVTLAQWREDLTQEQLDDELGASNNTQSIGGREAALRQVISAHCASNSTSADIAQGICTGSPTQPRPLTPTGGVISSSAATDSSGIPVVGRDLSANTILNPTNGVLSPTDQQAANLFLLHTFVGKPLGPFTKAEMNTENGANLAAERMTAAARDSVAMAAAASIVSDTVPLPTSTTTISASTGSTTGIGDWAEGTAKQVIGYNADGTNFPNGVSMAAARELRAKAWFLNPNWALTVDRTTSETALIKDLLMIQSYSVYQNWEQHKQFDQMNLTLATMLSIMEQQSRLSDAR
jgi:hypothetical protein